MTLWTKETITGDLRDLPAGVQEIRTPEGELCRLPLPESGGRGRSEEIRLCDWATMRLEWYEAEGFHSRHGARAGLSGAELLPERTHGLAAPGRQRTLSRAGRAGHPPAGELQ